jgi:hypothetical protein
VPVSRSAEGERSEAEVERNGRLRRPTFKQVVPVSRSAEGERSEAEVERETGVVVPGTKRLVEFVYRLAKPV